LPGQGQLTTYYLLLTTYYLLLTTYYHACQVKAAVDSGECLLEWDYTKGEPTAPLLKDCFGSERRRAKVLNLRAIHYYSTSVLSTTTQPPCYPLLLNLRAFHYYSLSCTRRSLSSLSSLRAMHCALATMHCAPRTTCCPLHTHTHTHTHAHTHTHTHTHMHTHHTHMHMRALRLTPGAQLLHRLWQDRAWPGQGLGCDQDRGAGTWSAGPRKYVSRE